MKTITFQNQQFLVPEWAKFIARDKDGEAWVFDYKPFLGAEDTMWYQDGGCRCQQVRPIVYSYTVACEEIV